MYEGPDRRKSDDMPGWAYQMQSDIRDIKTTLSLKLEPFAETCRKVNEAYDIANQHEKVLKNRQPVCLGPARSLANYHRSYRIKSIGV